MKRRVNFLLKTVYSFFENKNIVKRNVIRDSLSALWASGMTLYTPPSLPTERMRGKGSIKQVYGHKIPFLFDVAKKRE